MNPFPELSQLNDFFGSTPDFCGGPEQNWFYGRLRFVTSFGDDRVECDIEPGEYFIHFRWQRKNTEIMNLKLGTVNALELNTQNENTLLCATFHHQSEESHFFLQLNPFIQVSVKSIDVGKVSADI